MCGLSFQRSFSGEKAMSQSKPKTVRGYFRGKKQVASDTHEPAPVDIDTTKIVWATQTNFSVAAKCGDLIDFVNRNMFSKSSPFGSLYRTLLRGLPIDCPELVVHFDVVRVGNIHSQRVTFIEVEARELRKKFVLPNSFIGGCWPVFVR